MEKLVTSRLTYHLEKNKLLTNVQTGFRKGKSTTYHIFSLQDAIIIIIIIIIIRNLYSAIMPLGGYRGAGGTGR